MALSREIRHVWIDGTTAMRLKKLMELVIAVRVDNARTRR